MNNAKISIVIPAYNAEVTLKECLESVLRQTYRDREVIVVDNNSSDNTKSVIREYQDRSPEVKYIFEAVRARGAARNTGEKAASGDIILMTDSDCVAPVDWAEKMVKPIIHEGYQAVQGSEEPAPWDFHRRWQQAQSASKENLERTREDCVIGRIDTKNFAIRKDVLGRIGFTARKYYSGNDTELSIRLAKNNVKVRFLSDLRVKHIHPSTLWEIARKSIYRARWVAIISRDHRDYLRKTNFLKYTCQTPLSFLSFFPGLIGTAFSKGFKYSYYNFVIGISWRIGLISSWLTLRSHK